MVWPLDEEEPAPGGGDDDGGRAARASVWSVPRVWRAGCDGPGLAMSRSIGDKVIGGNDEPPEEARETGLSAPWRGSPTVWVSEEAVPTACNAVPSLFRTPSAGFPRR